MKTIITIASILFLTGCHKTSFISLKTNNQNKIIALVPLEMHNQAELMAIQRRLSNFFNIHVMILGSLAIPPAFRDTAADSYSADSLAVFLKRFTNDSVVEVVGITHEDIYAFQEYDIQRKNRTGLPGFSKNVFGLGYLPGNACIISDYRLMSTDTGLLYNRLRKVIIHEIGHNLGLRHCSDDQCLMSAANGNMEILNKKTGDFCTSCRKKLN